MIGWTEGAPATATSWPAAWAAWAIGQSGRKWPAPPTKVNSMRTRPTQPQPLR